MKKIFKFNAEAREKLQKGVDTLAESVATTLGPLGYNVAIGRKWGVPNVIHDGVSVAKAIELDDPFEDMGAQLVREASLKTNQAAGDGTTTATVLAQAIVTEGFLAIENKHNIMMVKKGFELATNTLIDELKQISKPITTQEEREQVAMISAQDAEIGKLVAEAITRVGDDGVVTVEDGMSSSIEVEYHEGMEIEKGLIWPDFANNDDHTHAVIEECYVLVTNHHITNGGDIQPLMQDLLSVSRNILIIADEFSNDALATLYANKERGIMNVVPIKSPGWGDRRVAMLEDIAILTGATFIPSNGTKRMSAVRKEELGKVDKVVVSADKTVISGAQGDKKAIDERIQQIKAKLAATTSDVEREILKTRLAKLTGGVAVIHVGALNEVEAGEKKERVIDAVSATKAAIAEGIVPGGETALIRAAEALKSLKTTGDIQVGVEIITKAIKQPFIRLVTNAGLDILDSLSRLQKSQLNEGIDVTDGQVKDLIQAGVIDPTRVTRSALQNAVAAATMILTTQVLIQDKPEEKK